MEPSKSPNYAIPGAIVIAGVLIAGSLYFGRTNPPQKLQDNQPIPNPNAGLSREQIIGKLIANVPPATEADHYLGSLKAKVAVIEYSDIECPFCQRFHVTMQKIMSDYSKSGNVAWIYRQFPLDGHPDAYPEALAAECVAADKGNIAFWGFLNTLMGVVESQTQEVPLAVNDKIKSAAEKLSLDPAKILSCVDAATYKQKISAWRTEAVSLGLGQNDTGTPFGIIVAGNKRYFIDGAQPYEAVKALIETALAN